MLYFCTIFRERTLSNELNLDESIVIRYVFIKEWGRNIFSELMFPSATVKTVFQLPIRNAIASSGQQKFLTQVNYLSCKF